jgi:thimet oligopeptidase
MAAAISLACISSAEVPQNVKDAIARADASVKAIVDVPAASRTYANTLGALDDLSTRLDTDTSLTIFMQYVSKDAQERQNARDSEEALTQYLVDLGQRDDLYQAIKGYVDTKPALVGEQKRLMDFTMRDYRRSGMALPKAQKDRVKELEVELQKLGTQFEQNIYEDETSVLLTTPQLKGVPSTMLTDLQPAQNGLYILKVDEGPTTTAILDYASIEATRQRTWLAYKRRGGKKNADLLEKMLKLRDEHAHLLGYKNTVDYEVEPRMAKNSETIAAFYRDLKPIVRKKALVDYQELQNAKRAETKNKNAKLYPWDQGYYKNLLMRKKYAVDTQKISEYFPAQAVFDGLFKITASLYGISFKDVTAQAASLNLPLWDPEVKLWEVDDKASGEELGHIYTDLYPRENKYDHAACWGLRARKVWPDGTIQKPLAALVTNFTRPTATKPSLMTHDEVETFFHEFGHGLHNLLTQTTVGRFSGTQVAQDFVEAPSQMFENWVWQPEVLNLFAKNYKTGQPLPPAMLAGMKKAQTLASGLETEHQMYYGLVDQAYHTAPGGVVNTTLVGIDMMPQVELYPATTGTMFQSSFGHLVGYEGAYYGYLWSLVYAQDMFSRFEEKGILNPEAGMYYRTKILARGGSMDEMDMLRDYLGREPKMDGFLKRLGLGGK